MAYEHVEDLNSGKQSKVLLFLTFENAAAGFVGAIIGWQLGTLAGTTGILLMLWAFIGAIIGISITIRPAGLSMVDRLELRRRAITARWLNHDLVKPHAIGRVGMTDDSMAVTRDGAVVASAFRLEEEHADGTV